MTITVEENEDGLAQRYFVVSCFPWACFVTHHHRQIHQTVPAAQIWVLFRILKRCNGRQQRARNKPTWCIVLLNCYSRALPRPPITGLGECGTVASIFRTNESWIESDSVVTLLGAILRFSSCFTGGWAIMGAMFRSIRANPGQLTRTGLAWRRIHSVDLLYGSCACSFLVRTKEPSVALFVRDRYICEPKLQTFATHWVCHPGSNKPFLWKCTIICRACPSVERHPSFLQLQPGSTCSNWLAATADRRSCIRALNSCWTDERVSCWKESRVCSDAITKLRDYFSPGSDSVRQDPPDPNMRKTIVIIAPKSAVCCSPGNDLLFWSMKRWRVHFDSKCVCGTKWFSHDCVLSNMFASESDTFYRCLSSENFAL